MTKISGDVARALGITFQFYNKLSSLDTVCKMYMFSTYPKPQQVLTFWYILNLNVVATGGAGGGGGGGKAVLK